VVGPIDNNAGTFYIENPATPGVAFPGFTRNGVPIDDNTIALACAHNTPRPRIISHTITRGMVERLSMR
jgi:hypothetical protein